MTESVRPARIPRPLPLTVEMSDGGRLSVLRYPSSTGAPAPAVVVITPYRKESAMHMELLAGPIAEGYEVLVADVRGFGGSTGAYHGVLSPREIDDGVELLEWIAAAGFCTGRTALVGGSYSGLNQLLIARREPRGLRCIAPWVAPADTYRDMWKRGGIPSHTSWGAGVFLNSQRPESQTDILRAFYQDIVGTAFDGETFRATSADLASIRVPAFFGTGWFDYFLAGTVRAFRALPGPKRLQIGPWSHEPFLTEERREELSRWLGYWLRDTGEDPCAPEGNAVLWCVGADEFHTRGGWPATSDIDWWRWEPVDGPAAVPILPSITSVPPPPPTDVHLMVDVSTNSGFRLWGEAAAFDSAPCEEPVHLLGPVALHAVLVTEGCADFDLNARLSVVGADGDVRQLTEGRLRASHRALDERRSEHTSDGEVVLPGHPHETAEPVPDGEPVRLVVEIYPVHLRLSPGERLRLGVTLTRSDASDVPVEATLLPATFVLLPRG
ncbi:CocE/NonD family hydrolase [Actinomadura terrae]|uniref:CocE/NonD family hydrolase n=1 Tax=Actinomadura terrae TaxID=604353 RepID=UPI001FA80D4D|nr:CocE/NonD family hydrolase [Actinomadura terrae]